MSAGDLAWGAHVDIIGSMAVFPATTARRRAFPLIGLPAMRRRGDSAFTLIELLVVIAIIALLVTLLVPALTEANRHALVVICTTNLHAYSMGLTAYAVEDDRGEYPQNTSHNPGLVWEREHGYPPPHDWLDMYLEMVCGGNGNILWCALDRDMRPGPKSTFYYDVDRWTDPRYGDMFFYSDNGYLYWVSFVIFAGFSSNDYDWSHSGNRTPQATPAMTPGTSGDVILADMLMSDTGFINNHADNPRDYTTHREDNAAYCDAHVETHHKEFTSLNPWPHWDEHYIRSSWGTYWLY